ncbi:MAG: low molecular weight protein arginine phosphatase [Chloroflexota bacterium]
MMNILLVCDGNVTRSPIAAAFLRERLQREPGLDVSVDSAGLDTDEEVPSSKAVQVMQESGIDISQHRPKLISEELVDRADVILTMTPLQAERLLQAYRGAEDKTHVLGDYIGEPQWVEDPDGAPVEAFRETRDQLSRLTDALVERMKRESGA